MIFSVGIYDLLLLNARNARNKCQKETFKKIKKNKSLSNDSYFNLHVVGDNDIEFILLTECYYAGMQYLRQKQSKTGVSQNSNIMSI